MNQDSAPKRGYLNEDFRIFFLRDRNMEPVSWHYHSFHKITFFLSGRAAYAVEGQSYTLEPGDLVLVPAGAIHRPEITPGTDYERYILYLSPDFINRLSRPGTDLSQCFKLAQDRYAFALRPQREDAFLPFLQSLIHAQDRPMFGTELLCSAIITQLLVLITRDLEDHQLRYISSGVCDGKIVAIVKYLNLHLGDELSIDDLAKQFYISKYYMMRRFKAETGYTIHNYLTEKRLQLARQQISKDVPLTEVSENCGFGDYSTFSRAYKRRFGVSPSTPIPANTNPFPQDPDE